MKSFRVIFSGTAVLLLLLFSVGGAQSANTISLVQGWNLISLPVQPANAAIASVLSGITGIYEVVWAYPNQTWQVYDPNDTAGSTLTKMQAGNGYWIKMTNPKTLSVSGSAPSSSVSLVLGWNLVGYNGTSHAAVSDSSAGLSALGGNLQVLWGYPGQAWQFYDPTNAGSSTLTQLLPGAGYWINVSPGATWVLGSVSGTAASGSAIANFPVTLVDKNGVSAGGTTGPDGSFAISGTGALTPPFMLKVQTTSGALYSVSADSNTSTTVNITPLTDMIIRSWYTVQGASVDSAFTSPASNPPPTPTDVKVISSVVLNIVQGWLQTAGVDTDTFNLVSTPFTADGTGVDAVLDQTAVAVNQAGAISVTVQGDSITQNSTVTPSGGSVTVSTTQTSGDNTTSPVTTTTVVPTNTAQSTAINGIDTTITNFVNTVNQKGASLKASDLAPYVDSNYLYNGENASQWETNVASDLAGPSLEFSGLQINSLDTSTNIADVTFQITQTQNNATMSQPVETNFKPINGAWLITGNGQIADAYAETWAYYRPSTPNGSYGYQEGLEFGVSDPTQNDVKSVTVSGSGVPNGSAPVPVICSYNSNDCNSGACPLCENSHGDASTQKAFQLDVSGNWPSSLPSTYTFTLNATSGTKTYTSTINAEFGFDTSGNNPVPADYPSMTFTGGNPTLLQILSGTTLSGSVYVPVWTQDIQDAPHFNYEGPDGNSNDVSNIDIEGSWSSGGFAIPGQVNNFTITIPPATIDSSSPCQAGSGTCDNITFQGQQGQIQGGWFGYDAGYGNAGNSSPPVATTNSGIEILP